MKRIISIVLIAIIALSAFSVASFSASTTKTITKKNANYQYTISNNQVEIRKYIGKSTAVSIPSKIDNKKVTSIGVKAFYGNDKLKSVKIPSTVEYIRGLAFDSCVNLSSVVIPNSVKKLGNAVFFSCSRLKSISLSKNLISIGKACFYNCSQLKEIILPGSLRNIGAYVFGDCAKLNSVIINNGPTYISKEMFYKCPSIKSITLPDSIEKISRKAFLECTNLAYINITDRITHIGSQAFDCCTSLNEMYINTKNIYNSTFNACSFEKLVLGDRVENIADNAFQSVTANSLKIPSSVKNISSTAFYSSRFNSLTIDENNPYYAAINSVIYTKDMKKIIVSTQIDADSNYNIPNGVQEIGDNAFLSSTYTGITIPDTVTKIGKNAFKESSGITKLYIPNSVTDIEEGAFSYCYELEEIHLPENLTVLNKDVLDFCPGIKNLTIPDSVQKIYTGALSDYSGTTFNLSKNITGISPTAFGTSSNIINFTVDEENKYYSSNNGLLYSKDGKTFKMYPQGRRDEDFSIPNGTKEIGTKAIYTTDELKNVTVPTSVTKIDDYAIFNISGIKSITVPSSVKEIGKYALGYNRTDDGVRMNSFDLAIIGTKNSQANKYAKANSVPFFTGTPKQNVTSKSLAGGKSFTVKVANISQSDLIFSSSNDKIATVDKNGKVTGIRKGTTYIFASINTKNFKFKIQVTSNAKNKPKTFDDSSYFKFTKSNYNNWTKDYYKYNTHIKYTGTDNPSIKFYTSNDYIYLHALAGSERYKKKAEKIAGNDYDQFIYFLYGTNLELNRFKLHKNTVFYRGSSDISNITGTSYTLKDMKNSIGKTYTDKTLVSTSIDHAVSNGFYDQEKGALLEIYAPKDVTKGGYIEKVSQFSTEREFLIASNTKFKVIDAGIRYVSYYGLNYDEKQTSTERYMKLLIVK